MSTADHDHGGMRTNAVDPTESQTLRRSFRRGMNGRLREVRGETRSYLGQVDVSDDNSRVLRSFRTWFERQMLDTFVDPTGPRFAENGRHWTASYVRQAYEKGLRLAREDLEAFGAFDDDEIRRATRYNAAEHRDRLSAEYLTAYYGVEDVANRLKQHATTTVEESLRHTESYRAFGDSVTAEMRKRANESLTALANTVIVETVNAALLTSFERAGVAGVGVAVESLPESDTLPGRDRQNAMRLNAAGEFEWETAGDDKVCPQCQALAGVTVEISKVRGKPQFQPPVHPNCRCRLIPTGMEVDGEVVPAPGMVADRVSGADDPQQVAEELDLDADQLLTMVEAAEGEIAGELLLGFGVSSLLGGDIQDLTDDELAALEDQDIIDALPTDVRREFDRARDERSDWEPPLVDITVVPGTYDGQRVTAKPNAPGFNKGHIAKWRAERGVWVHEGSGVEVEPSEA